MALQINADAIAAKGYIAKGYAANVLDKDSLAAAHAAILADLGTCDILINGAGGNNPRATTDKEYFEIGDIDFFCCINFGTHNLHFVFCHFNFSLFLMLFNRNNIRMVFTKLD